jgi:hypothetical protein
MMRDFYFSIGFGYGIMERILVAGSLHGPCPAATITATRTDTWTTNQSKNGKGSIDFSLSINYTMNNKNYLQ